MSDHIGVSLRAALSRRSFLSTGALSGVAAAVGGLGLPGARSAWSQEREPPAVSVRGDGTYDSVPLRQPTIQLGVVQSRVRGVDARSPQQGLKENLAHMLDLIDASFHFGGRPDILFFHEFPLTGWNTWTRAEILRFAPEIPGEESEAVGAKAKEHGCYVVFGSYAQDRAWPDHVLSLTTIIGPDGRVVDRHWKARNIKGVFPGVELFTTTIYDVLDRYVEMYGPDAVIPVSRTDIGNIATSSIQLEPELFRAFAIKGTEIMLRTATGGFNRIDVQACAIYNRFYSAIVNNAVSPDNPGFFAASATTGGSAVFGPTGEVLAEAGTQSETLVRARIPIAEFRRGHQQPFVHMDLYRPVFGAYQNAYGPNLFDGYLPEDLYDAKRYLKDKSRWTRET
jgi:predicted amidohydrolase